MNITLLACRDGRSTTLSLRRTHFAAAGLLASIVFLGIGAVGFWLGQSHHAAHFMASWQAKYETQQRELHEVRQTTRAEVESLSDHMAELQGRLSRLDALGRKLVEVAHLEITEFDFEVEAGAGGPLIPSGSSGTSDLADLRAGISEIARRIEDREHKLGVLEELIVDRELQAQTTPAGWPIERGWISSSFGYRTDPITGRRAWHGGTDFAANPGTAVYALASGVVTWSGRKGAYGNLVEIDHGSGYVTRYAHNKELLVRVGEVVRGGHQIAKVGSTGRSTGPHVHLEVFQDGEPVNPAPYASASR